MKKKTFVMLLALVLVFGIAVGGTLALLTAKTEEVKNTFTPSTINIKLEETKPTDKTAKMLPGATIEKDPKATVLTGSEDCWLFVEVTKSANFDYFMTFEIADGWTLVEGTTNVYGRKVAVADMGTAYSVLKNDRVTVKDTVTKEDLDALTDATYPTLTFKAYAVQLMNGTTEFTAAEAWEQHPTT
jgi:predicted ribosomally synthesized peptide with SipW-like signal peptide